MGLESKGAEDQRVVYKMRGGGLLLQCPHHLLLLSQVSSPPLSHLDPDGRVVEVLVRPHFIQAAHSSRRDFVLLCKVCVRAQVRILLRFISMQVSFILYWLV